MQNRKEIKKASCLCLRGHYGAAGLLAVMPFLLSAAVSGTEWLVSRLLNVSYFADAAHTAGYYFDDTLRLTLQPLALLIGFGILELLLTAPLRLGIRQWFLRLSADDAPVVSAVFRPYTRLRRILKAFWLRLTLLLRCAVLWVAAAMPALLVWVLYAFSGELFSSAYPWIRTLLFLAFLVTFLTCQVLYFYWRLRYFLAEYLYLVYPCKIREAVKLSVRIMKGKKNAVFSFYLSCIPLVLLALLILPAWYALPRLYAAQAGYARALIEQHEAAKETVPVPSGAPQQTVPIPDLRHLSLQ